MSDTLGAAPYYPPPPPSLWERLVAWGRARRVSPAPPPAAPTAVDVMWSVARLAGRTAALSGYKPPPAKNGPRPTPPRIVE